MTDTRPAWTMAKFTGLADGPVYIDLHQVAAVTDVLGEREPRQTATMAGSSIDYLPGLPIGARVILHSGVALFTKEAADTVFEEVRRARTEKKPEPDHIRIGDAPIGDTPAGEVMKP